MNSGNLGNKRVCPKCDAKFYDFGVIDPIKCPKCGKTWTEGAKKKPAAPKKETKPQPKQARKPTRDDDDLLSEFPDVEGDDAIEELEPMEDDGVELTSLEEVEEHEEEDESDPNSDDAEDDMFTDLSGDKIVDDFEEHEDDEDDEDDEDSDDEDDEDEDDDDDRPKKRRR